MVEFWNKASTKLINKLIEYDFRPYKPSDSSLTWTKLAHPLDQSYPKIVVKDAPLNLHSILILRNILWSFILFFYQEEYQTHLFEKFEECWFYSVHKGLGGTRPIILNTFSTPEKMPYQTTHKNF